MKKLFISLITLLTAATVSAADIASSYEGLPVNVEQAAQVIIGSKTVNVKESGAMGDGVMDATHVIQRAIDQVSSDGGGRVIIPAGVWISSPLRLKAGVDLHLEKNCVLEITSNRSRHIDPNTSRPVPCIYAENVSNVSISGQGIINGNGDVWRMVKRINVSKSDWDRYTQLGGTITDKGDLWYPFNLKNQENFASSKEEQEKYRTHLIRFNKCEKVKVEGVTIVNSPKFHIALMDCKDVTIDGVNINSEWHTINTNGIDISTSQRILIQNCEISCGGVAIVLKAAMGAEAARHSACENIVVANNTITNAVCGFMLGTEFTAGINNVVFHDNTIRNTHTGVSFRSSTGRGGKTSGIHLYNIYMTNIKTDAIAFETDYFKFAGTNLEGSAQGKEYSPEFRDINIKNVYCSSCNKGITARGSKGSIREVTISDSYLSCKSSTAEIAEECRITTKDIRFRNFK